MPSNARILQWRPLCRTIAATYDLPPDLVLAVIAQESSGNPFAIRVERGFWRRYVTGIRRNVLANHYAGDDRWLNYPDLAACSYGLMQIMWPVAIERGATLRYPTELCDPAINIDIGCRHLTFLRARVGGSQHRMLLRYNGGGDPQYPTKIMRWRERLAPLEAIA